MTGSPVDTVLITGAFGQVGRRCAELLLNRGRTVIATDLRNDKSVVVAQELASQESPGTLVRCTPICSMPRRCTSLSPSTARGRSCIWPR